jgi:hypothetical protein
MYKNKQATKHRQTQTNKSILKSKQTNLNLYLNELSAHSGAGRPPQYDKNDVI